jgi:hypothetical protein
MAPLFPVVLVTKQTNVHINVKLEWGISLNNPLRIFGKVKSILNFGKWSITAKPH